MGNMAQAPARSRAGHDATGAGTKAWCLLTPTQFWWRGQMGMARGAA